MNQSRRTFLKSAAYGVPTLGALQAGMGTNAIGEALSTKPKQPHSAPSRIYIGKNTRLSISMWDFSWLMGRYQGGPYADLEQRVVEAAERGYNTLRIDCFPSRILERESTLPSKNWTAGVNLPIWGEMAAGYTCNVRSELANLADLCRKHNIWLGLDSWDKAHMFRSTRLPFLQISGGTSDMSGPSPTFKIPVGDEENALTAYGEVWVKALKLMREDGVLERAVWIAPMNEVPHFGSRRVESILALEHAPKSEGETKFETTAKLDTIYRRLNGSMGAPIKSEIAGDRIPLSYSSLGAENYAARVTDIYDVVDLHFMPEVILDDQDKQAFQKVGPNAPYGSFPNFEKFDLKAYSISWDNACRKHYSAMLERVSRFFKTALNHMALPSGKQLQAIVTEAYGPCIWPDNPKVDWQWYKRYNADALRIVAQMDLAGATLSNYGEPLFTLWDDLGWHWAGNTFFRTTPRLE